MLGEAGRADGSAVAATTGVVWGRVSKLFRRSLILEDLGAGGGLCLPAGLVGGEWFERGLRGLAVAAGVGGSSGCFLAEESFGIVGGESVTVLGSSNGFA